MLYYYISNLEMDEQFTQGKKSYTEANNVLGILLLEL